MDSSDVTRTVYRVSDFISWQKSGSLVLSPNFQRRPVWNSGAKSYLIDTVVRGLPIPVIFLRDQRSDLSSLEPRREIVDGQQRIRTLISFIDPSLLVDYEDGRDAFFVSPLHNKDIAGRSFPDLPIKYRQEILDYEFSVHVLSSGVDDRDVLGLFARMNSTGVKLNFQELRNAEYFGAFKTSMYEMAATHLQRWREWNVATETDIARMQEVELTSEFALMMMNGVTQKSKKRIDDAYKNLDRKYPMQKEIEHRFHTIMDTIDDKLGASVVLDLFKGRTLFYGLFAAIYELQYGLGAPMEPMKPRQLAPQALDRIISSGQRINDRSAPDKVLDSVTRRTTNLQERNRVFSYIVRGECDA